MEPSVLERQRAMLQRIYHSQQHDHHLNNQCNSSLPTNTKKRKAEIDIEGEGEEKSEITTKTERESCGNIEIEKPDYIHVRARRGQATDSHSLAERARREKISKKMKCLQDLVPGCDKVTGKAGMLDEIINYVQSLQKQVEFLSMKLSTVNPRLDVGIDNIFSKEIQAYIAQLEESNSSCFQYNEMQNCGPHQVAIDESQITLQKAASSSNSLPIPEVFLDSSSISQFQQLSGWESDWQQTLFSAGFH